ncbi:hypothetical protein [Aureliella helgolandensis]|uniref:Uncharacterized protein n=1 Tax=Aureliella helgolandensis TaxID=2527968 RepID=A0A518G2Q7_9BACT|nr:hypothetical protein [Aureliella helgolandensis]QDV22872.1 hypothetical protein Q31a_11650 [Aureliella helgolandensis]
MTDPEQNQPDPNKPERYDPANAPEAVRLSPEFEDFRRDLLRAWDVLPMRGRREYLQDVQMASGMPKPDVLWAWQTSDLAPAVLSDMVLERWPHIACAATRRSMLLRLWSEHDRARTRGRTNKGSR